MKRELMRATASLLSLLVAAPATLQAQSYYAPAPYAAPQPPLTSAPLYAPDGAPPPPPDESMMPGGQAALPPAQASAAFSTGQLDQLLAPIALYPDDLLSQVLMAATYPLDIVEASRWLRDPRNAALRGDALAAALEQQQWDPSVKSLVPFPQVLQMLDARLDWTQQLGQAFLGQQDEVMNSVQRLRQEAANHGALNSTPQQIVENQGGTIEILPANPTVVYVPSYDPRIVYGSWAYPEYPPVYFAPRPGYVVSPYYAGIGFGVGIGVVGALWGWHHWDWDHHRIDIDRDRYQRLNYGRPPPRGDVWEHDAGRDHGFAQRALAPGGGDFRNHPPGQFDRAAPARAAPYRGEPPERWTRDGPAPNRGFARPQANLQAPAPQAQPNRVDRPNVQAQPNRFDRPNVQAQPSRVDRPNAPQLGPQARNGGRPDRGPQPAPQQPQQSHASFARVERPQPPPQAPREAPHQQFAQRPSGPPPQAPHQAPRQQFAQRPSGPPPQAVHQAQAAAPQPHAAPQPQGDRGHRPPDDRRDNR